jgi:hypothetical protein
VIYYKKFIPILLCILIYLSILLASFEMDILFSEKYQQQVRIDASKKIQKIFRFWIAQERGPQRIYPANRYQISKGHEEIPIEMRYPFLAKVGVPIRGDYPLWMRCVCVRDKSNPYVYFFWPISKIPPKKEVEIFFSKRKWTWIKNIEYGLGMGEKGNVFSERMCAIFYEWKRLSIRGMYERKRRNVLNRLNNAEYYERVNASVNANTIKYYDPIKFYDIFQELLRSGKSTRDAMRLAKEIAE